MDRIDFYLDRKLFPFQSSQPLFGILHLSNTRVSILPERKEFLVLLFLNRKADLAQQVLEARVGAQGVVERKANVA